MDITVSKIEYFYTTIEDKPGEGYRLLARFRRRDVKLLAFTAFPCDPGRCQLDFLPEDPELLLKAAREVNLSLTGPKKAFLIQGNDTVGVIADIYRKFLDANIDVHAGNGVSDGRGGYRYILWVNPLDYDRAAEALGAK